MNLTTIDKAPILPVIISSSYKKLIACAAEKDKEALALQVEASPSEYVMTAGETEDPLGASRHAVFPFLIHQYENRVLLLLTKRCLSYCRFCFRKNLMANPEGYISQAEMTQACNYISAHSEIREVLVSGGDPLSGSLSQISRYFQQLRAAAPQVLIRIATRAPIFTPERFTPELISLLTDLKPLWIIPHINHPAELGAEQSQALSACINAGIAVQSQSVLLKGVNDSVDCLVELFNNLVCLGIKPGYLFQTDKVLGTAQFRVPLKEALELYNILRRKLSGLSLPQFAVDLPDGGGKFSLGFAAMMMEGGFSLEEDGFFARGYDKEIYHYVD